MGDISTLDQSVILLKELNKVLISDGSQITTKRKYRSARISALVYMLPLSIFSLYLILKVATWKPNSGKSLNYASVEKLLLLTFTSIVSIVSMFKSIHSLLFIRKYSTEQLEIQEKEVIQVLTQKHCFDQDKTISLRMAKILLINDTLEYSDTYSHYAVNRDKCSCGAPHMLKVSLHGLYNPPLSLQEGHAGKILDMPLIYDGTQIITAKHIALPGDYFSSRWFIESELISPIILFSSLQNQNSNIHNIFRETLKDFHENFFISQTKSFPSQLQQDKEFRLCWHFFYTLYKKFEYHFIALLSVKNHDSLQYYPCDERDDFIVRTELKGETTYFLAHKLDGKLQARKKLGALAKIEEFCNLTFPTYEETCSYVSVSKVPSKILQYLVSQGAYCCYDIHHINNQIKKLNGIDNIHDINDYIGRLDGLGVCSQRSMILLSLINIAQINGLLNKEITAILKVKTSPKFFRGSHAWVEVEIKGTRIIIDLMTPCFWDALKRHPLYADYFSDGKSYWNEDLALREASPKKPMLPFFAHKSSGTSEPSGELQPPICKKEILRRISRIPIN